MAQYNSAMLPCVSCSLRQGQMATTILQVGASVSTIHCKGFEHSMLELQKHNRSKKYFTMNEPVLTLHAFLGPELRRNVADYLSSHATSEQGVVHVVYKIFDDPSTNNAVRQARYGDALPTASGKGHEKFVEVLLAKGVNVSAEEESTAAKRCIRHQVKDHERLAEMS